MLTKGARPKTAQTWKCNFQLLFKTSTYDDWRLLLFTGRLLCSQRRQLFFRAKVLQLACL